jgi:hypothetical protein
MLSTGAVFASPFCQNRLNAKLVSSPLLFPNAWISSFFRGVWVPCCRLQSTSTWKLVPSARICAPRCSMYTIGGQYGSDHVVVEIFGVVQYIVVGGIEAYHLITVLEIRYLG